MQADDQRHHGKQRQQQQQGRHHHQQVERALGRPRDMQVSPPEEARAAGAQSVQDWRVQAGRGGHDGDS
jgi:hypothetical protein